MIDPRTLPKQQSEQSTQTNTQVNKISDGAMKDPRELLKQQTEKSAQTNKTSKETMIDPRTLAKTETNNFTSNVGKLGTYAINTANSIVNNQNAVNTTNNYKTQNMGIRNSALQSSFSNSFNDVNSAIRNSIKNEYEQKALQNNSDVISAVLKEKREEEAKLQAEAEKARQEKELAVKENLEKLNKNLGVMNTLNDIKGGNKFERTLRERDAKRQAGLYVPTEPLITPIGLAEAGSSPIEYVNAVRNAETELNKTINEQKADDNYENYMSDEYSKLNTYKNAYNNALKGTDVNELAKQTVLMDNAEFGKEVEDLSKYYNAFTSQANYIAGDLGLKYNEAMAKYFETQNISDLNEAQRIEELINLYNENAENVGKGGWIRKDFANYAPQLVGQTFAGVKGAIKGGATGAVAGGTIGSVVPGIGTMTGAMTGGQWGAKAGYVAGVGEYSYTQMIGSAYSQLLDLNIPNDIAREVASDTALWQSVVEMTGSVVDLASLGLGSKAVKGVAGKTVGQLTARKMIANALKAYGINILSEGTEEAVQEKIAIEGEKKAFNQAGMQRKSTSRQDLKRIGEAWTGGAKIAAISGGGNVLGNVTTNLHANNKINNANTVIAQNQAPQSSNSQIQNTSNNVSQLNTQNQNTANVVQNNTDLKNNIQNQTENGQIITNNVQNQMGNEQINQYSLSQQQNSDFTQGIQTFIENRNKVAPGLNIVADETLTADGIIEKRADGTRTIKVNPNSSRSFEFVVMHEMLHDLEGAKEEYQDLSNFVKERAMTHEDFEKAKTTITEQYTKYYQENGLDMSGLNMEVETTNDMVARALGNQEFLNELAGNKPNVFMRMYNWVRNVLLDGQNTGKTFNERRVQNKYLQELKSKFEIAYNTAYNNSNSQTKYSIAGQKGLQNAINNDSRFQRLESNLMKAQQMAQNGIDNEYIRQNTNWFQDKNGDWKFEFSDKDMSLKKGINLVENNTYRLGDILEHDILFTIYPELANYNVKIENIKNARGSYNRKNNLIRINSKLKNSENIQSTLIHEIQHAIQKIEGFERGQNFKMSKLAYYNSLGEIEADDTKNRYIAEKSGTLNRDLIPPESSKASPSHSKVDNYLNNRTTFDKIKDGIYRYLRDRGVINDSIFEELDLENTNENTGLVVRGRRVKGLEKSSSFSLSKVDNQGRTLTKEQQEYFKNSKVRDKDGNLKTVYHGTDSKFTIFNYDYLGKNGTANGKGFYFADDINVANSYGDGKNLIEAYVDIEKPLSIGKKTMSESDYIKFVEAVNEKTDGTLFIDYGDGEEIQKNSKQYNEILKEFIEEYRYGGDDVDLVLSVLNSANISLENGYRLLKNVTGYDGIVVETDYKSNGETIPYTQYIPLTPEQIKNVDNTNPTDNPDIRYSQSNDKWQSYLDKNWDLMPNSEQTFGFPTTEELQEFDKRQKEGNSLVDVAYMTEDELDSKMKVKYKHEEDKDTPYKRKFFENARTSSIVSQEVKENLDVTHYERQANEVTLAEAQSKLDEQGDSLIRQWSYKKKDFTAEDVAIGAILLERYQQNGDIEAAVDVVQKLADMGTEVGRAVQMYSIFQRLTPEAMLIYQQRKLNDIFKDISKKKTGKWVEANKDKFKLTENDSKFITEQVEKAQQAETERQKQIELAKIESRINEKLPPERGQSIKAFRRIAMLFNPKTQIRNVVGNALIVPVNDVADIIGTKIDKAIAKKTGVRTTNYSDYKAKWQGFKKGVTETIEDHKLGVRTSPTGSKYEFSFGGKSFNENTNLKAVNYINNKLNAVENILNTVMSGGDRPFYEATFNNSLQGQMKANNVTTPTQEMIDIAVNEALSRTWNDDNGYTKAVLGIRRAMNKLNVHGFGLGDLIIPFAKTPANLTKAMVEYSPLGAIEAIIDYCDMRKAISRGEMTAQQQKKFVESTSKAITGTILRVISYALAKSGATTGSADDDKDVRNFEQNVLGIQPYSIKIGDKTFTYSWANPISAPLAIMADTYKMSKENANLFDILTNGFKTAGEVVVDNSFLQGIKDLFEADSISEGLVDEVLEMPTQFVPTFLSQTATLGDKTKRQTFEYGDGLKTTINQVKNKLPWAKNTLAPQVNTFGEEIENYGGDNHAFNVFLNPANSSKANASDTQKELYALYEATQDTTIFPRQAPYYLGNNGENINLSSYDRVEYQKTSGAYVSETLSALFEDEFYESLENDDKVTLTKEIISDADNIAKSNWLDTKTIDEIVERNTKLEEAEIPLVDYYIAWLAQKDVEGKKNLQGNTISGTKKRNRISAVNKAVGDDLTSKQKNVLYELLNID